MDLATYQVRANQTDRNPGTDEKNCMIPLTGLASETGELLGEYKKFLRDGASHKLFKERLAEELGDLLWYVANVATKFGLELEQVATENLAKCDLRWGAPPAPRTFDSEYPISQRIPRQFSLNFIVSDEANGKRAVRVMNGDEQFGDVLTDNSHQEDGYAYHDVLHLAFAAVLGWSPLVRKMLHAKRKSNCRVDEVEDGGRAVAIEEGVSAMIFAYARDYDFLEGKASVSSELLRMLKNMVSHLEVSACTTGEWEQAIIQGMSVWRALRSQRMGAVDLDLDERTIRFRDTKGR